MNKKTKYAINGAAIVGFGNGILNIIHQLTQMKENPELKFDWQSFFKAIGKGALVGGVGGLAIGAYADYKNSKVIPLNTDASFATEIEKLKLNKQDQSFLRLNEKAEFLVSTLKEEFGIAIQSLPRLGSTENGTALKQKFDIDIGVNFKPGTFRSTEEMYSELLAVFNKMIGQNSITKIRDQKKSIGVYFNCGGREHKIDVVPCKLTPGANGDGYLYVNDRSLFGSPSYTKTNIKALNSVRLSPTQQKIAIVLKKWKEKENLPLSSHLLQNLILDAYAYTRNVPRNFTAKVVMVLRHVSQKLDVAVIRGIENTNNVITNIPAENKKVIIEACKAVVERYEYQPNSILTIIDR